MVTSVPFIRIAEYQLSSDSFRKNESVLNIFNSKNIKRDMNMYKLALMMISILMFVIGCDNNPNSDSTNTSQPAVIDCVGAINNCPWVIRASLPNQTSEHVSITYGSRIFVLGGALPNTGEVPYVYSYESDLDIWEEKQSMPTALWDLGGHAVEDKIYIFSGLKYLSSLSYVLEYDIINDIWLENTAPALQRVDFMSTELGGKIFVIGGVGRGANALDALTSVKIYNPVDDNWTNGTAAPENLKRGAICSKGDIIYIFGGTTNRAMSETYAYNTITDSWSSKTPSQYGRYNYSCTSIGGLFYLIGGSSTVITDDNILEIYNPDNDTWEKSIKNISSRNGYTVNSIGTNLYIVGGTDENTNSAIDAVEMLDVSIFNNTLY